MKDKSTQSTDGFTMIELLVGAIIAFLIIGPLLGFVVNILNDDTREQAKVTTDYELQAAVDFISEDLSQAYYIYDPDQIEDIENNLPDKGEPILVFWKLHRLPNSIPLPGSNISPNKCDDNPELCNDTSVRALVSYHLVEENNNNSIWCQPAGDACPKRIVRYMAPEQLEKFRGTGVYYNQESELDGFQRGALDLANSDFDLEESPTDIPQVSANDDNVRQAVLVNYVSCFSDQDCFQDQDSPNRIDVADTNDSVKFTIRANARRRRDGEATEFCDPANDGEGTAECPQASVRVEGLDADF